MTSTVSASDDADVAGGASRRLRAHAGSVIRAARVEAGLSRAEVARRLGYSHHVNLLRVEDGSDNPTLDRLARIAAHMGGHLEVRFVAGEASDPAPG